MLLRRGDFQEVGKLALDSVTRFTAITAAIKEHSAMATVLHFPTRRAPTQEQEPTLRDILRSRGIESTGEERNKKHRERAAAKHPLPTNASSEHPRNRR